MKKGLRTTDLKNISALFLITKMSLIIYWIRFFERAVLLLKEHETQFCSKLKKKFGAKLALAEKKNLKSII